MTRRGLFTGRSDEGGGGGLALNGSSRTFRGVIMIMVLAVLAAVMTVGSVLGSSAPAHAAPAAASASQVYVTAVSAATSDAVGGTRTLTFSSGITATETNTAVTGICDMASNQSPNPGGATNAAGFLQPTPPTTTMASSQECYGPIDDTPAGVAASRTSTITFSKPVLDPILYVQNIDSSRLSVSGTSTTGAPITSTTIAKNTVMDVATSGTTTTYNNTVQSANNLGCQADDGTNPGGACGSFQLSASSGLVKTLTFNNNTIGSTLTQGAADGWLYTFSYPTAPLTKSFTPTTIAPGGTSKLTFSIANPSTADQPTLTPLDFTDNLPAGLTLADTTTTNAACGTPTVADAAGGALSAGATGVTATNITVAAGATCTITVDVTASDFGTYTNNNTNLSTTVANLVPNANTSLTVPAGTPPSVTCTTDPATFDTGYNAANGGTLADGSNDATWTVAGGNTGLYGPNGTTPAALATLPPAGTGFAPAQVGKVNARWADSPFNNAQWVSGDFASVSNQPANSSADWYYEYQFNLDPSVDPGNFALDMNWFADNDVAGVWVNNTAQTGPNLPQNTTDPYNADGFNPNDAASTTLDSNWKTGLNTIIVQIKSFSTAEGFDAQVTSTALCPAPAATVVKHAGTPVDVNHDGLTDAGDTIAYTFTVTNTGNVPLTNVGVTDAKAGAVTCTVATLAPAGVETCTADSPYVITAADVTAGGVDNTATSHGTPPSGPPVTSPPSMTHTGTTPPAPGITVKKTANVTAGEDFKAGQKLTYSFIVTNTGNVPLANVTVNDTNFSGTGTLSAIDCPTATLAAGASTTCTATYTLTQADVDSGTLTNTATTTGTPPPGDGVPPVSPPSGTTVPLPPAPGISILKSVSPSAETDYKVGEVLTYSFAITNTGNVTETDVAPDEGNFTGTGTLSAATCPAGAASLAPGVEVTCAATYTVTQADVDAGHITNAATATGSVPGGGNTPPSNTSTVTVPHTDHPALALDKTANVTKIATVGQSVTYSFKITNTGDVTEKNVKPDEGKFTGSGTLPTPTCPAAAASLAPGASVTCTSVYHVTSADLASGELTNTATATGTSPDGPTGSNTSTADVNTPGPVTSASTATGILAFTGSNSPFGPMLAGGGLVILGLLAFLGTAIVRRRRNGSNPDVPTVGIEDLF